MITKNDIVQGLRALGVVEGDILMVHSALSSLGRVDGGADALIDALIEAVGPSGTVAMPTLYLPSISGTEVFDVNESPSQMGAITEVFRKRAGVVRSVHPTHPTAAYGARAQDLIADHAKAPTACGVGTPFGKLAEWGGKVLLMGVDQDRNTLLHTAEDYADCPFLSARTCKYRDPASGEIREIHISRFPGPHRDFIGLEPLFREAGIMSTGKVGKAMCRLMDAGETVRIATEALKKDPSAVLCDNPSCTDCVRQKGSIRRVDLDKEDFTLSVRIDDVPDLEKLKALLWRYGVTAIEIGPKWLGHIMSTDTAAQEIADTGLSITGVDITGIMTVSEMESIAKRLDYPTLIVSPSDDDELARAIEAASAPGLTLLMRNDRHGKVNDAAAATALKGTGIGLAFDPSEFAAVKQMPFLSVYYHGIPKSLVRQFYVKDGTFDGDTTEPGMGNGEIKELISILRCRSFDGVMTIWPRQSVESSCEAFWDLLKSL